VRLGRMRMGDNRLVAGGWGVSGVQGSDASSNWGSCVTIMFTAAVRTIVSDCRRTVTQRTRGMRAERIDVRRSATDAIVHCSSPERASRATGAERRRITSLGDPCHCRSFLDGESASSDMSTQPPTRRSSAGSSVSRRGLHRREKRARTGISVGR
jgi:hypothetical protein